MTESRPIYVGQLTVDELREILREERAESVKAEPDKWLTIAEAADYLGTSVNTLHKATASKTIQFAQNAPRSKCYFKREWLDDYRLQTGR